MNRIAAILTLALAAWSPSLGHGQALLYHFDGDSNGDRFGVSVSGGVDVNNDGVNDVIVGASADDNNGSQSGMVRIFSGQNGTMIRQHDGADAGDVFGRSVSGLPDIDGDGFDDYIVGAPFDSDHLPDSGSATVYSGQTGAVVYVLNPDGDEDHLGRSVANAGDIDGDGTEDFIVGAPEDATFLPDEEGYARVYSGATGGELYTFHGAAINDGFGWRVSGVGDADGDSRADVIVGASRFNTGLPGYAIVFSGQTGAPIHVLVGDSANDLFSSAVAGAGDVNNDGRADFIVGAEQRLTGVGYAKVYSGVDASVLHTLVGQTVNGRFGAAADGVGDMDFDGFDDVIVGAWVPFDPDPVAPRAKGGIVTVGYVEVYSGRTGDVLFHIDGSVDGFGVSVSRAGDVNQDGAPDFIVGAWQDISAGPGVAEVFAGPPPPPPSCAPVGAAASAAGAGAFAAAAVPLAFAARRRRVA